MNSVDKIRTQVTAEAPEMKNMNPTAVAGRVTVPVTGTGMPGNLHPAGQPVGTIVSMPGTEQILFEGSTFQFMTCDCPAVGYKKVRHCIVAKGTKAKYMNQFINSNGDLTNVVTREVFNLMFGIINAASGQIRNLRADLERAVETRDAYKTMIDGFRKNGIID